MEYLPQFAACRDIGHQWDIQRWGNHGMKRELVCDNCDTHRIDYLDSKFRVIARRYIYPRGYHFQRQPLVVRQLRAQLYKEARKLTRWIGTKPHLKLVKRA